MAAPVLVDRVDIHKSCKSLETIVSILLSYTEASNTLAALQKKLAKALKEAASVKGTNNVPANAMLSTAGIFEGVAEVDAKFAKIVDKESENIGVDLKKWFRKLAKEEKAYDERTTSANAKIKQAGQAYEKKSKRKDYDAADEHSRYVAILSTVGPEMSQDKYNHTLFVTQRHTTVLSGFGASLSRLAEAQWARACEHVRRSASSIGNVGECRVLCEGGWTGPVPDDLPNISSNDGIEKSPGVPQSLMIPQSTSAGPIVVRNEYSESPTNPFNSKFPISTHRSSEGRPSVEHPDTATMASGPPSPLAARELIPHLFEETPPTDADAGISTSLPESKPPTQVESSRANNIPISTLNPDSADETSLGPTSKPRLSNVDTVTAMQDRNTPVEGYDLDSAFKPETKASLPQFSQHSLSSARDQANITRKLNSEAIDNVKPSGQGKNVKISDTLDRRLSVESATSNNSLVATMRDLYDIRPTKPASPRDLPRLAQSVTDLASHYTAIETSRSDNSASAQSGLSADRFPTFQDRYIHSDRDKDRFRVPLQSSTPNRANLSGPVKERYRHAELPTMHQNQSLREDSDHERYRPLRPRSPDEHYFDELGMRVHQRRINKVDELSLEEREAKLHEQERQLKIERVKLANARDGGYASDSGRVYRETSPYGVLTRSESPNPLESQHSLRSPHAANPYDHSPNCGCQRCSAQHYASTPSLPRSPNDSGTKFEGPPIFKPDPPIVLRPEKPKNWIRRMSMPVTSLVSSNDKKTLGVSNMSGQSWTNIALPEADRRVTRRSFELERDRETVVRLGGTTRR